jgi:uroporphyrin-III C-methyltransferase / precorrin-2 dehydrogenase / sirohydrochlorin ferrochelatase
MAMSMRLSRDGSNLPQYWRRKKSPIGSIEHLMDQLPIFVNLAGSNVVLIGDGDAAEAKRRLIERAGGVVVGDCPLAICKCARIAFIALDDDAEAQSTAQRLRAKGMQVNVVDRPAICDFTTPAIIDRNPVIIAIGTGGASAGLAKALRQRLEGLMPQSLGRLAQGVSAMRDRIRDKFPDAADRRRAIDAAFMPNGPLDPFSDASAGTIDGWLDSAAKVDADRLIEIELISNNPDDLTLRTARLLGEADHLYCDHAVTPEIQNRARADAVRYDGAPPRNLPTGLIVWLRLPQAT